VIAPGKKNPAKSRVKKIVVIHTTVRTTQTPGSGTTDMSAIVRSVLQNAANQFTCAFARSELIHISQN
jgi:hypothetical protein